MIKVKTASGFEGEINEDVLNDVEIIDIFGELDDGNPVNIGKAAKKLFKDDYKRLYDHVRTEDDRVPIEALAKELSEIITSASEIKK